MVVLFNGFQKKTQKTPKKEIEKADLWKQVTRMTDLKTLIRLC